MPKRKFALTAVLDKCLFPLLSAFHQRVARIGLWLLFSQFCLVAWAFIKGTSNNDDFVVGSTAVAARRSFSLLIWRGCVSAFCGRRPVQGASGEPRHYAAAIRSSVTSRRIL